MRLWPSHPQKDWTLNTLDIQDKRQQQQHRIAPRTQFAPHQKGGREANWVGGQLPERQLSLEGAFATTFDTAQKGCLNINCKYLDSVECVARATKQMCKLRNAGDVQGHVHKPSQAATGHAV